MKQLLYSHDYYCNNYNAVTWKCQLHLSYIRGDNLQFFHKYLNKTLEKNKKADKIILALTKYEC